MNPWGNEIEKTNKEMDIETVLNAIDFEKKRLKEKEKELEERSQVWLVINKTMMDVFGVYDSEEKALRCVSNLDSFKKSYYYVERKIVR